MDDAEIIAGIQGRLEAIGSPEWEHYQAIHLGSFVAVKGRGMFGRVADVSSSPNDYGHANAEFIASSPTDIAFLLEILAKKDRKIAELSG